MIDGSISRQATRRRAGEMSRRTERLRPAIALGPAHYVVWDRIGQSVVLVRQDDGSLRAWHNVCQHRGARLAEGEGPNGTGHCRAGAFTCPWHGFRYNLAGEVRAVPLRESFDARELDGLRAPHVAVTEWGGLIWIRLLDGGPPLAEFLGTIGEELSFYHLDSFETRYRATVELNANWKMVVDAFNETWHVPFTHVDSLSGMMLWRDARLKITPPHSWMTLPVRNFTDRAPQGADHRSSHLCHYLAFPNTIFSCFPTHLQMWSAWPVSPTKTVIEARGLMGPAPAGLTEEQWTERNDRGWQHFMQVMSEDAKVIDQLGATQASLGFTRNLFCTAESRLTAFHAEVDRCIGV